MSDDESEVLQLRMNDRGGQGNGAADAPPSRAARSVSPDDFLVESSSNVDEDKSGDLVQRPIENGASRELFDAGIASKFKVITCSGPSCLLSTSTSAEGTLNAYDAFVRLAQDRAPTVQVEESSVCLIGGGDCNTSHGGCCVEVRHEQSPMVRKYANLKTEGDAAKVWSCVEAAIRAMGTDHRNVGGD